MSAKASAKTSKRTTATKPPKKVEAAKIAKATKAGKKPAPKAKASKPKPAAKAKTPKAKAPAKAKRPSTRKPTTSKPSPAKPAAATKAVPAARKTAAAATKRPPAKAEPAKAAKRKKATASATGMLRARVLVYPRREILDPQGKAIRHALAGIGFDQVEDVRAGKSFEITLSAKAARSAGAAGRPRELLTAMCERLLANSVVEDYAIELPGEDEAEGEGGPAV